MKRLKDIRARAGFTLAEVLAAGALIAVILGMVSLVLLASINGFARAARQDGARQLGLAVYDFYRDRMVGASEISINSNATGAQIRVQDGRIFYATAGETPAPLYPDSMYAGASVRVEITEKDGAVHLTIEILDGQTALFRKQSAFRTLALERAGNAVLWTENAEKSAQNPVVYVN